MVNNSLLCMSECMYSAECFVCALACSSECVVMKREIVFLCGCVRVDECKFKISVF